MEDEPMFEFPCDYSDVEANFVDYCYDYYGIECGSWRKFATRNEIVLATKIRLLSLSDDDHYEGDTMDREMIRDIIQQAQYFTWKLPPFVPIGYEKIELLMKNWKEPRSKYQKLSKKKPETYDWQKELVERVKRLSGKKK